MDEKQELYNRVRTLTRKANSRMNTLEKKFGHDTYAVKILKNKLSINKLDALTEAGRSTVRKNMSVTQMRGIEKAINNFLNSQTSTVKGIKDIRNRTIDTLRKTFARDDVELSVEEAEKIYGFFSDENIKDLTNIIPASQLQHFNTYATEKNLSERDYKKMLSDYIDFGNDENMKQTIKYIYDKYVVQ